jgi:PIN domain nuclease of toxin-antitoxin system
MHSRKATVGGQLNLQPADEPGAAFGITIRLESRMEKDSPAEASWFSANLEAPVSLAPLTAEISTASCRLPDFHGDPADRIIVATAITLGIPLITADEKIIRWIEAQGLLQVIGL